jgi:hypothetical protein
METQLMEAIMPLDLWTLLVEYTFGGFWLAVLGVAFLMFILMAIFGRVSRFTTQWYLMFFLLAMALGYGYNLLNVLITIGLLFFIWMAYQRGTT